MRYCFDIDGTLCNTPNNELGKPDYINAKPFPFMVEQVNRLYDEGNYIIMQTARGKGSGIDHTELTKKQLDEWGYKYHELFPMFCKPNADIFIDDKGVNAVDWAASQPKVKGIIAGAFDIIHPGYVRMFEDCRMYCNHLTVALHADPSLERDYKLKPVHSVSERIEILLSMKYVDSVVVYAVESEFHNYLSSGNYDVRFLGTDYIDGKYTGKDIDINIVWLDRESHEYSSTRLKNLIFESVYLKKMERENYD
jgi:glycerol-3-phosphate cytidylyltransferase